MRGIRAGQASGAMPGVGLAVLAGLAAFFAAPARADSGQVSESPRTAVAPLAASAAAPTYADLVALTEAAPLILKAEIRSQALVEAARAAGLRAGRARLYLEAAPLAPIAGALPAAPLAWLVDVPLDSRGKPPKLKKAVVLAFARPVAGAPGQLQLVAPAAQIPWTAAREAAVRTIRAELAAPGAPPAIVGVRELSYVPGELVGTGVTQIFLATAPGAANGPASITVEHRAGEGVRWSASFADVMSASAAPPAKDTLAWFRLACALPAEPPAAANISDDAAAKAQALVDYRIVRAELGPCVRHID